MRLLKSTFIIMGILCLALVATACGTAVADTTTSADTAATAVEADVTAEPESTTAEASETVLVEATDADANANADAESEDVARPAGWSEETHSKSADPNYEVVFPDDEVNTLTITIDPENWQAMLDDMTATYGEPGSTNRPGGGGGGQARPGGQAAPPAPDGQAAPGGRGAGPGQGGFPTDLTAENPIWVPATIEFEGDTWTDVGVRFKGNSSLMNTWSSGSLELPFKLDFDEFEDENPAIDDQRFYGFKQLSLSNNYNDATLMHDALAYDVMAEAGIASAETAYYELFVDYGEGPVSFGLYTMIEVVDDTVIDRVFGDDDGNIYEGDGTAVSLATGTYDGISTSFQKENNEDEADWSDIEALYTTLHADTRLTDPTAWKAELESIFDVDTFLNWLAINTIIENWDTYGGMTHNFYLYNNPETGQLTWIPWDYNEAFSEGRRSSMTFSMEYIGEEWPLISYLLADEDYYATYVGYVDEAINTVLVADDMEAQVLEMAALIEPYAAEEVGAAAFSQAVEALIAHIDAQTAEAASFVAQETQP